MNKLFQMIKKDHQEVKGILGKLKESKQSDHKKREELFHTLKQELVPHMKAEEAIFYTPLMAKKEAREEAMEGMEEHHVSELVLKELDKMSKDDDKWIAKVSVFKELVEHHIQEEESVLFKAAEKALSKDELDMMAEKVEEEKQKIKKKLK